MKLHRVLTVALVAVAFLAGAATAEEKVVSGPQPGEKLAGPFHPLNVTGDKAGEKFCLYCVNGNKPVAMIFAREPSAELAKLIKKIDDANAKAEKMGSFVVFLNDDVDGLQPKLKKMAEDNGIKQCVLSIDNPAGPKGYKVAKDADVTVVLYVERVAKANHSFKKGELNEKAIENVVTDLPKILSK